MYGGPFHEMVQLAQPTVPGERASVVVRCQRGALIHLYVPLMDRRSSYRGFLSFVQFSHKLVAIHDDPHHGVGLVGMARFWLLWLSRGLRHTESRGRRHHLQLVLPYRYRGWNSTPECWRWSPAGS